MFRELELIRRSSQADGLESLNVKGPDKQQHRVRANRGRDRGTKMQKDRDREGEIESYITVVQVHAWQHDLHIHVVCSISEQA